MEIFLINLGLSLKRRRRRRRWLLLHDSSSSSSLLPCWSGTEQLEGLAQGGVGWWEA